jgi:hypothetical protein
MVDGHLTSNDARILANSDEQANESTIGIRAMKVHLQDCEQCQLAVERARLAIGTDLPYNPDRCLTDDEIEDHIKGDMDDLEMVDVDAHILNCDPCNERLNNKMAELTDHSEPPLSHLKEPYAYPSKCLRTGEEMGEDAFLDHIDACKDCNEAVKKEAYEGAPPWAKDWIDGRISLEEAARRMKESRSRRERSHFICGND